MSYNLDIQDYNYGGGLRSSSRFAVSSARAKAAGVVSRNIISSNVVVVSILAVIIIAVVVIIQT